MKFSKNQKEFPTTTHQSIWHAAVFMAPFYEIIPPQLTGREADDLRKGEKSLYQFMTDLYSSLYDNPEVYYLPVGEYDSFMNGRDRRKLVNKDVQKESRLRNRFQQAIQFYQKFLFEVGTKAEPEAGSHYFSMHKSILSDMITKHNLRLLRGEQEKRAEALSHVGIELNRSKDKITISNNRYPKMLVALSTLCKGGNRKFALTNFQRCDFRGLMNSYQPGFDDAVSILPNDFKKTAVEMDEFMQSIKCKISVQPLKNTTLYSQWKLSYSREGKSIYSFHSDTNSLEAFAYFNYHGNVSRMGYLLKEESDRLYTWFFDRIPTRLCSCRNNKLVDIGGHKKRICGLMNRMDVINPDSYDLKNLKRTIEICHDQVMK